MTHHAVQISKVRLRIRNDGLFAEQTDSRVCSVVCFCVFIFVIIIATIGCNITSSCNSTPQHQSNCVSSELGLNFVDDAETSVNNFVDDTDITIPGESSEFCSCMSLHHIATQITLDESRRLKLAELQLLLKDVFPIQIAEQLRCICDYTI